MDASLKTDSEPRLLRAHFWASCAIMFGVGYMALSLVKYGIIVAMAVTFSGALAKIVIHSRLERLNRAASAGGSDAMH
jgi:fructose-specific phosphotransferase system IIC component